MKTRTRELAKPGIYGTVEDPQVVREQDLREIAETFPDIKKAPVSMNGHHWLDAAKPRLGNVIAVSFDEATKVLSGTIEEQDALADAVDQGFFPDCSIGARRRASDGKMYLHHLAYLGEEPPAVKDLVSEVAKSLDDESKIAAGDEGDALMIPPVSARQLSLSDPAATNPPVPKNGADPGAIQKEVPPMELLQKLIDAIVDPAEKAKAQAALDEAKKAPAEVVQLKEQLGDLAKKYPDAGIALSDATPDPRLNALEAEVRQGKKDRLTAAMSGRVPKAKQADVLSLSDSLSMAKTIELSDGDKKTQASPIDVLVGVFEAIPRLASTGRLDLGDGTVEKPIDLSAIRNKI